MNGPCASAECSGCSIQFIKSDAQPYGEHFTADGIEVLQMVIPKSDTYVPQHTHIYDHLSMLAKGAVDVWADGVSMGRFTAPAGINIKAGVKHLFRSCEDMTIVYCVHNVSRTGQIESINNHHLVAVD